MKTLIGINNLTEVNQCVYANHMQFFYRLGKSYPNDDFALCNPRRMSIDRMRNFCAKAALEAEFDYLMFIDDDVCVPWEVFKKLHAADKDIVAGVTLIRGYPYHPMIFDFARPDGHYMDDYMERAENGIAKCDAVGFSCCLIKVSLLKKMRPPFFITGPNHTEDVFFCMRAKEQIPDVSIYVDTTVQTGHILGTEIIEPQYAEARRLFDEQCYPDLKKQDSVDRGDEYLKRVEEIVAA